MSTATDLRPALEASIAQAQAHKAIENPVGLRQKLLAIMAECGYIQKDKRNQAMGYNYASESTIKEKIHAALVRYGVLFQCDVVTFDERLIERTTKDGRAVLEALAKCQFHYCFEDVETGDKREGTFFGTGVDSADKHLYKAVTGAIKYILTTTFLIATGDDPEDEPKLTIAEKKSAAKAVAERKLADMQTNGAEIAHVGKSQPIITDGQRKRLYAMRGEAKLTDAQVKSIMLSYGFDSSTKITAEFYESICEDVARCAATRKELPMAGDYYPGNHVLVNGTIYRLSLENIWEPRE